MLELAAYSLHDISKASSRLRSFYLLSESDKYNIRVFRDLSYYEASKCQVIHLQSVLNIYLLFWLILWRINKINIIYDIADQPGSWKSTLGFLFAIFLSNTLTVNTNARLLYWQKFFPFKNIVVIPDIIDKPLSISCLQPRILNDASINFLWIGHEENIPSIEGFFPTLDACKSRLLICTNIKKIDSSSIDGFPIDLLQWREDITFQKHNMHSFMLLSHNHNKNSVMKSNNKMVLAICSGFIPIVSRTPEYEALAKELNLEFLLFDDFSEVFSIAKVALSKDWTIIFKRTQSHLEKKLSRMAVFNMFKNSCIKSG